MTQRQVSPKISLRWRALAILSGIMILFWLPFEETSPLGAVLLAVTIAVQWAGRRLSRGEVHLRRYILDGVLAGLLSVPCAWLLMLLKSGIHAHGVPDFSIQSYRAVLYLSPWLGVGGGLIAWGIGLWQRGKSSMQE